MVRHLLVPQTQGRRKSRTKPIQTFGKTSKYFLVFQVILNFNFNILKTLAESVKTQYCVFVSVRPNVFQLLCHMTSERFQERL